jgi:multidrug efflux pump subunit AcrB
MYFLKRKTFTIFLLILAVAGGLYSLDKMSLEFYPEINVPVVLVQTVYPGASSSDIEESVTEILEELLIGGIDQVDQISSTSQEGISVISIQFFDSVDISEALIDVKDKIEEVSGDLPSDANEPIVTKINFSDQPIYTFALSSNEAFNQLRDSAEEIESRLLKIPGISNVEISGIPEREITVLLDADKLSQFNLLPQQVISAIRSSEQTLPVGDVEINDRIYRLDISSDIKNPEDLNSVIIKSNNDGSYVYLKDVVVTIENGLSDYTSQSRIAIRGQNQPQQAIIFDVRKQEGGDITALTKRIQQELEIVNQEVGGGYDFITIFDGGENIQTNLSDLINSGLQTIVLVVIVMGLMVGFKESFIAAIAIPLAFVLTFIGMLLLGQTINFITLFSLILVIGILIDSSIVIVEGIQDFKQEGYSSFDAARKTLEEYTKPVIAGVLTTISIFVPLLLLSGTTGQFIGGIPRVVNIVLVMAVVVALVFIPLIANAVYALPVNEPKWLINRRQKVFIALVAWYKNFLEKLLANSRDKRRIVGLLIFLFFGSFSLVGFGLIQSEFFPPDETDRVYINIEMPKGTPLEGSSQAAKIVEGKIKDLEHVEAFTTIIGSESQFVGSSRSGSQYANIILNIDDKKNGVPVAVVAREALQNISMNVQVLTPESGPPVGAPFQIRVIGENWEDINSGAVDIATYVESFNGSRDVDSGVDTGVTDLQFVVLPERLSDYGLSAFDISAMIRTIIFGTEATTLSLPNVGDTEVIVKVSINKDAKTHRDNNVVTLDDIRNIPIQTARGEVLLDYFVDEGLTQATSSANHRNGERLVTVTAYVEDGFLPVDMVNQFNENSDDLELPDGIRFELAGSQDANNESSSELIASLGLGILLVFGVLIWQFGSIRDTFFIVSVIPLGLIGVLFGLLFADMNLSFTALLGFIALVGIVVNDSIILVDVMNNIRLRNPDKPKRDVVIEGATARLRPVIVTTVTTVLGMIPLLFVSPLWGPFAYAVIVGLSFATILTLIFIPMLYDKFSK